jgi:1,4-alpha-glucan branching enzyme
MLRLLPVCIALLVCSVLHAQLLTWGPDFPVQDNPVQNFTITVDASKGNKGLLNHSTGDVYVHIGVITNVSAGAADWKYVKFQWASTGSQARATYAGNNKWQYTINGSLKDFFGITSASEQIQKIALLFRSGDGNKKQTNSDGSDLYIPVYTNALAVRINQPPSEPKFNPAPEIQSWVLGSSFTFQASANIPSALKLYLNGNVVAAASNTQTVSANATIIAEGAQQLVAEATEGTVTKYDTVNVFIAPTTSPVADLPAGVRDGLNYEAGDTSVTLVLFAPGKSTVTLLGDFNNWTEDIKYIMKKTPDGQRFWLRLTGLTPGTEYAYQYKVDNLKIADFYTQKVLDPWNDQYITAETYPNLKPYPLGKTTGMVSVLQTAAPAYTWGVPGFNRPDKRSLVIYELLVRDFVAKHDWATLTDTLDYLKRLGINAIELMPFNEFEGNNSWGYNPDFYFAPDKYYGTANSLKRFVDSCHARGIAVIMDIALNHSFGLSPMVQLYAETNGWPTATNPWFNPDQNTTVAGYQGKHPFGVGYDVNHESAAANYFTSRVVEHWLKEYKIDGFRFDLSKGFTQKSTGDNVGAWSAYDASRIATWKKYYDTVQTKSPGAYVILEHFADNSEEKELAAYGMLLWGNMAYNYQEAAMGWLNNSDISGGLYTIRNWQQPHLISYMESHDEERIVFKNINYGNAGGSYNIKSLPIALKRMELNAAFFFTTPGPKMLWQFGELGYDYSINRCEDGTIKDDCRTNPKPIRWDYFDDPARKQVYKTYSQLINLRFHPLYQQAFTGGQTEQSFTGGFKWLKLTTDTSKLMVIGNFDVNAATATITFPATGTWYSYLDTTTLNATTSAQTITLQPGEFRVFLNRNLKSDPAPPPGEEVINAFEVIAYPNPVPNSFQLKIKNPEAGNVSIQMYNAVGQRMAVLHQGALSKGTHLMNFERHKLRTLSGIYFIKVVSPFLTRTIQILIP